MLAPRSMEEEEEPEEGIPLDVGRSVQAKFFTQALKQTCSDIGPGSASAAQVL